MLDYRIRNTKVFLELKNTMDKQKNSTQSFNKMTEQNQE